MSTIFLSYARGDDEPFVRQLYDDLTKAKFDVWFDRVNMPSRGLTFHQEIREAISNRDRLLLVVGPQAVKSEYVRQEWQYAWFDAEKVVTPILRIGDYPLPIPELTLLHCEDFRNDGEYQEHLKELIRILREPAPPMGKVIGAPSLPAHFLTRTDRLISLRDALRSGLDSPAPLGGTATHQQFHGIASVSRQVGLHGMGGIGKSVLANLLARDREVRKAFPDGIVWIGMGSLPNIVSLMQRVHQQLGGEGLLSSEHEGQQKLKELLAQKAVLLVIDDVWRRQDVDAFNVLGPRCRALITTRDAGLLTSIGGTHHLLQLLTDDEALRLLAVAVGEEPENLPIEAHEVLAECGRLPLAIALAGGMAKSGVSWSDIRDALREHDLEYISDEHRSETQHQSLWRMIEVSVNALTAEEQQRLVELVVFPEDTTVPEAAITTLWETTGNVSPRHARKLLTNLKQRSLIQLVEDNRSSSSQPVDSPFFLHDLIHDYGVARHLKSNGDLKALHSKLLSAYEAKAPHGWWSGPNDGYYFQNLLRHLSSSGRDAESIALLTHFEWLATSTHLGLAILLARQLEESQSAGLLNSSDGQWYYFFKANAAFLAKHPVYFFQQAYNEPSNSPISKVAQERWDRSEEISKLPKAFLEWTNRPAEWQESPLLMTLYGHDAFVTSVALSNDESFLVSGSRDGSTRVWDATTGACLRILQNVSDYVVRDDRLGVRCVAISSDGCQILTGSNDYRIRVWDTRTGTLSATCAGHDNPIRSVAISHDGNAIVAGAEHSSILYSWAGINKKLHSLVPAIPPTLRGRYAEAIDGANFMHDNRTVIVVANDLFEKYHAVRFCDIETTESRSMELLHPAKITDLAITSDQRVIVTGSTDGFIRVWDVETGQLHTVMAANTEILSVAISDDGNTIATGDVDGIVSLWNVASEKCTKYFAGHTGPITSIAINGNGQKVISASLDKTIKVWSTMIGGDSIERSESDGFVECAIASVDLRTFYSTARNEVKVWDVENGRQIALLDGHADTVTCIAVSGDGSTIVTGSSDGTFRAWSPATGLCLTSVQHPKGVVCIAISQDGRVVVTGAGKVLYVWDLISGDCISQLTISPGNACIDCVAISGDASTIVYGCAYDFMGENYLTSIIPELQKHPHHFTFNYHHERVSRVGINMDGRFVISECRQRVFVGELNDKRTSVINNTSFSTASHDAISLWEQHGTSLQEWLSLSPHGLEVTIDSSEFCKLLFPGAFVKVVGSRNMNRLLAFDANGKEYWFTVYYRDESTMI